MIALYPQKMVSAYLALWKVLDIYFASHRALEITNESVEEVTAEVQDLLSQDLSWSESPEEFRKQIEKTLTMSQEPIKDQRWLAEAAIIKAVYQEKALEYAAMLPVPQLKVISKPVGL